MPQPISNTQTIVSGSLLAHQISYVVDGQGRNYRGGFGGLSWMSEVQAENNVIFISNTNAVGRGPANSPLFYPALNNTEANIIYAANNLPGSPGNLLTLTGAYDWAATNHFFINNSDNPIPRINADGMVLCVDANQPTSYPETGTSWYDLSGPGNNGTLINGPTFNSNGWIEFDGTDDYISFGNVQSLINNTQGTISIWVNPATTSLKFAFGWFGNTSNYMRLQVSGNGITTLLTEVGNVGNVLSSTDITPLNQWTNIVITQNGTNSKIHINGVLQAGLGNSTWFATHPTLDLYLGYKMSWAGYYYDGKISNFGIYNRALSTTEILQNYYQAPIVTDGLVFAVDANNLVSYPKSGTTTYDLAGSNNGTLINGVGFDSANGGSWTFDGTDDYINLGNQSLISGDFCIDLWYELTSEKAEHYIFSTGYQNGGSILIFSGGIWLNSSATDGRMPGAPGGTINEITNITVERTNGVAKWYKNGIYQYSLNYSGAISTNTNYTIGWAVPRNKASAYMAGNFYSSKIYNKGFTADEVQQNYEATKDKFLGQQIVENGLVLNLDAADRDSYARTLPPLEVLVVAGGGGGGTNMGGGGGGGGVIYNSAYQLTNADALTVTVGAGGNGAPAGTGGGHPTVPGTNGSNSVLGSLTAIGGGRGGFSYNSRSYPDARGAAGGSGGGATGYNNDNVALGTITGGSATDGQGNRGGNQGYRYYSGGGGGAGLPGVDGNSQPNGGDGVLNSILGTNYYWAGGGGGANYSSTPGGNGGLGGGGGGAIGTTTGGAGYNNGQPGGGGAPGVWANTPGGDAGANTGGGGGGGSHYNATNEGGNGGSGITIIRYSGPQAATGGTVVSANGYTTHTFTSSGTFTPALWNDLSGNNNGTLVNGVAWNPSLSGGAMGFDGVDDYATTFTTPPSLQGDPNLTVCAWMRRTANAGGNTGTWGLSGDGNGINSWWNNNANEITIDTWGTSTFTTGVTYPLNGWVFVAWQKIAGDMTRANCILWRNLVSYTGTQLTILRPENGPPNIGNNGVNIARISQTYGTPTPIQVGKFWIYDRVLSATEITQNYNATKGRFGL